MVKSYKKRISTVVTSTQKNVQKALPIVNDGLKTAGVVAKGVAKETIPIIEEGVSKVYGTINSGFNLASAEVKNLASAEVKNLGKGIKSIRKRKGRIYKTKYGGSRRSQRSSRRSQRGTRRR